MKGPGSTLKPFPRGESRTPVSKECVILFARYPAAGKVKTRLTPMLSKEQAAELYKKMLAASLRTLRGCGAAAYVYCDPAGSAAALKREYAGGLECRGQNGRNIGDKMKNAFQDVFRLGFSKAVLAGTDIPGLTAGLLRKAFEEIEKRGAVIGPAKDGGYYLIGFKKDTFLAPVFEGVRWGGGTVLADTASIFNRYGRAAGTLRELRDIDNIEDISYFAGCKELKYSNPGLFKDIKRISAGAGTKQRKEQV